MIVQTGKSSQINGDRMHTESHRDFVMAQFQASIETPPRFIQVNAGLVSQACFEMQNDSTVRWGCLLVFGNGASTTAAPHVSMEYFYC